MQIWQNWPKSKVATFFFGHKKNLQVAATDIFPSHPKCLNLWMGNTILHLDLAWSGLSSSKSCEIRPYWPTKKTIYIAGIWQNVYFSKIKCIDVYLYIYIIILYIYHILKEKHQKVCPTWCFRGAVRSPSRIRWDCGKSAWKIALGQALHILNPMVGIAAWPPSKSTPRNPQVINVHAKKWMNKWIMKHKNNMTWQLF